MAGSRGKGKVTAEEELRASKGKGKMAEPVDVDDDEEEDEEEFDEDVSVFPAQCILQSVVSSSHFLPVSDQTIAAWLHVHVSPDGLCTSYRYYLILLMLPHAGGLIKCR